MIRVMVGATGLDIVKGVASTSMTDPTAADTADGTLIAPNLVAPNHDHFFNYRLDFDVDGTENSFVRTTLVPQETAEARRRSIWVTQNQMPMTELEGRFHVISMHPAMYHVMNHGQQSGLRHHPGYMICRRTASPTRPSTSPTIRRPGATPSSSTPSGTRPTRGRALRRWRYAFQSDGSDFAPAWVKQNHRSTTPTSSLGIR